MRKYDRKGKWGKLVGSKETSKTFFHFCISLRVLLNYISFIFTLNVGYGLWGAENLKQKINRGLGSF